MGRKGSLFYQLVSKLKSLKDEGDKWRGRGGKHAAKQEYREQQTVKSEAWNPSKATGIFSHETFRSYAKSLKEFSAYLREKGIRNASEIEREHAIDFLREKNGRGLSHYTVSKDRAAIHKVFNYGISNKEIELGKRSNQEIVRGRRIERDQTYLRREKSNQEQIEFTKAFGTRRQSIQPSNTNYPIKSVSLFRRDGEIYCSLIEKGGKYREVECLEAYKSVIEERYVVEQLEESRTKESFQQLYFESKESTIFSNYDKNINNHAYRAEFACELYKQIEENWLTKGLSIERNYEGYNREICCEVAKNLGHGNNRPEIFVSNYAYGFDRI